MSVKRRPASAVGAACMLVSLALPAPARAGDSCTTHSSFVRLVAAPEASSWVEKLTPHLRAELDARDIGICGGDTEPERQELAEISLARTSADSDAALVVTIRDRVTDKSVSRTLDLGGLPADTRLLAIATSIDELLRASWLETLLTRPKESTPAPVRRAVENSLPAPPPTVTPVVLLAPRRVHAELGVDGLASFFARGRTGFGLDLHGTYWVSRRLGGYARAGFSRGLREDGFSGAIAAHQLRAGAGATAALLPAHERLGLRVEAGLDVSRVSFRGVALDRTIALATAPLFAMTAALGLRSWVDTGQIRWLLGVAAQYAVVSAVGTESLAGARPSVDVTGIDGLGFEASLGAAWRF